MNTFDISAVVSCVILKEKKKPVWGWMAQKRKAGSKNVYQGETEAVEGAG